MRNRQLCAMLILENLNNGSVRPDWLDCQAIPAPFAVNLDADNRNWVEPNISVICDARKLTERCCIGAPDLIVEIVSPSSQNHDCLRKLNLYQKAGVREYWIVNPMTKTILIYYFEQDAFFQYRFDEEAPVSIYNGKLRFRITDFLTSAR